MSREWAQSEARMLIEQLFNRRMTLRRSGVSLARDIGVTRQALWYWENYNDRQPTLTNFVEWANMLGFEVRLELREP